MIECYKKRNDEHKNDNSNNNSGSSSGNVGSSYAAFISLIQTIQTNLTASES